MLDNSITSICQVFFFRNEMQTMTMAKQRRKSENHFRIDFVIVAKNLRTDSVCCFKFFLLLALFTKMSQYKTGRVVTTNGMAMVFKRDFTRMSRKDAKKYD